MTAKYVFIFLFTCLLTKCKATKDSTAPNDYGVIVLSNLHEYKASVANNKDKELILLKTLIPNIITDLRYASQKNFTGQYLYTDTLNADAYLRLPAANALMQVAEELKQKNIGLKIYDAYRPYSATVIMWNLIQDEDYVANPKKGSGHNRGAAVDLTLIDLTTGKELAMPTPFDDFTKKASHDYTDLSSDVLSNRNLLRTTMEKYGFTALRTEWWHYSLPNAKEKFDLLDLSFEQLKAQN